LQILTAADALARAEDLLDRARQLLGERLVPHGAGDLNDLVEGDVAGVRDVLLLLAVTRRLCARADPSVA
jgi:hypothetical protein